jgi:hypothetical protein
VFDRPPRPIALTRSGRALLEWRVAVRPGSALDSPFSIVDVVTETR